MGETRLRAGNPQGIWHGVVVVVVYSVIVVGDYLDGTDITDIRTGLASIMCLSCFLCSSEDRPAGAGYELIRLSAHSGKRWMGCLIKLKKRDGRYNCIVIVYPALTYAG